MDVATRIRTSVFFFSLYFPPIFRGSATTMAAMRQASSKSRRSEVAGGEMKPSQKACGIARLDPAFGGGVMDENIAGR